jgi:hypothetical protein
LLQTTNRLAEAEALVREPLANTDGPRLGDLLSLSARSSRALLP